MVPAGIAYNSEEPRLIDVTRFANHHLARIHHQLTIVVCVSVHAAKIPNKVVLWVKRAAKTKSQHSAPCNCNQHCKPCQESLNLDVNPVLFSKPVHQE
eukprot:3813640-Amphidinium_carterae.1